jgi:hypothetical protein
VVNRLNRLDLYYVVLFYSLDLSHIVINYHFSERLADAVALKLKEIL